MIQWAKFGQMARKGLRARPKSLKTMEKIATKAKKIGSKAKGAAKKIKSGATLPAVGFGLGAATGVTTAGAVTYLMGYNRGKKKKNNGK